MHQLRAPRKATLSESRVQTPPVAPAPTGAPPLALVAVVVANIALAFGPWFVRLADTGPVAAGFWRMALAVPLIAIAAYGSGARHVVLPHRLWVALALAGIAFAADLGSWHIGIRQTTLANATLFGNSATFIFPIYGFVVARAWPSRMQGAALALAAAGAALLMGRSYQLDPSHLTGDLLCVLAGVLYAVYFVLMADARRTLAPLPALALSSIAALLPLLGFAWFLGERIMPHEWTPLIGLALVSQVLGQGCMIYALGKLSPLVVGLALLVQPVVAAAIGWVVYGETLGLPDLAGAAMVAVALVLVRRDPKVAKNAPAGNLAPEEER